MGIRRFFRNQDDGDTCHSVGPIAGHSLFATSDISASRIVDNAYKWASVAAMRHRKSGRSLESLGPT
jgi:hypothetical protein